MGLNTRLTATSLRSMRSLHMSPAAGATRMYTTRPAPIDRSLPQAHPIGRFYESIINNPYPWAPTPQKDAPAPAPTEKKEPEKSSSKAEEPPTTSTKTQTSEPTKATPAPQQPETSSPKQVAEKALSAEPETSPPSPPKRRGRKPKPVTAGTARDAEPATAVSSSSPPTSSTLPPSTSSSSSSGPPVTTSTPAPSTAAERARIVFGSSLAGPAARPSSMVANGTRIAGVLVPPRPEEPDNCCMSGCVNCVWERYREDMEEWSAADAEARRRLSEQREAAKTGEEGTVRDGEKDAGSQLGDAKRVTAGDNVVEDKARRPEVQKDEVMGVRKEVKIAKDFWDEDLYRDVPVGIREFMKTEKKLKERHEREDESGGS